MSRSTTSRLYLHTHVGHVSLGHALLGDSLLLLGTHFNSSGAAFSFTQARLSSPR